MAYRDKFSESEWAGVLQGPMLAGFAVTAADPGGLIGAVKESFAMAGSMRSAMADPEKSGLAGEIVAAYQASEGREVARDGLKSLVKGKKPAEACEEAVARLGEVMRTVEANAPEAADGFRTFLIETSEKTAEASSEGGFLGFGGEKVSDAERKTLGDIRTVLGAPGRLNRSGAGSNWLAPARPERDLARATQAEKTGRVKLDPVFAVSIANCLQVGHGGDRNRIDERGGGRLHQLRDDGSQLVLAPAVRRFRRAIRFPRSRPPRLGQVGR